MALFAFTSATLAEASPVQTPTGFITSLHGGWVNANLRVKTDFAWNNPENCSYTDGYMVDAADPGHELFSSMLISAFMSGKRIQLVLDGCAHERPRIISVELVQ
jgi:hypothetical protein